MLRGTVTAAWIALAASATKTPAAPATTNVLDPATGFSVTVASPGQAEEEAYRQLLALDDDAQEEMDRWIREADAQGISADAIGLQRRIDERIAGVTRGYREFLEKHPEHVRARIAFGSFLNDTGQEVAAREQWERALALEPRNPAIHNNLAGVYSHRGPITNAFVSFEKAIELDPKEPVYFRNFATAVFLFRKDAMEHYGLTNEQQVFDKALLYYGKAVALDPHDFALASDVAQTYYLIKPPRHDAALAAWQQAYGLASDELERQGVRVHLTRVQTQAGRFAEARTNLARITDPHYAALKVRLESTLARKEREAAGGPEPAPQE